MVTQVSCFAALENLLLLSSEFLFLRQRPF